MNEVVAPLYSDRKKHPKTRLLIKPAVTLLALGGFLYVVALVFG